MKHKFLSITNNEPFEYTQICISISNHFTVSRRWNNDKTHTNRYTCIYKIHNWPRRVSGNTAVDI